MKKPITIKKIVDTALSYGLTRREIAASMGYSYCGLSRVYHTEPKHLTGVRRAHVTLFRKAYSKSPAFMAHLMLSLLPIPREEQQERQKQLTPATTIAPSTPTPTTVPLPVTLKPGQSVTLSITING